MGKISALKITKEFLSDSYEEGLCKEIIRNSLLGLRKLSPQFQSFKRKTNRNTLRQIKNKFLCFKNKKRFSNKVEDKDLQSVTIAKVDATKVKNASPKIQFNQTEMKFNGMENAAKMNNINLCQVDANYPVGLIVWSRVFLCEPWPAIIIGAEMCGQKEASPDKCWVFWFGDHKISEVFQSRVYDFQKYFEQYYSPKILKKSYVNGVYEALKECWMRLNKSTNVVDKQSLLQWSFNEFRTGQNLSDHPNFDFNIPEWISLILKKYLNEKVKTECSRNDFERKSMYNYQDVSHNCKGSCMACKSCFGRNDHPFFYGQLCDPCKDRLSYSIFIFDGDGFNTSCIICAYTGELFLCDEEGCNKVYCHACLTFFIGEIELEKIRRESIWSCFLCCTSENECKLKPRENWREHLALMFQPDLAIIPAKKFSLRVLSLFDGISTGKVVLDELNIKTEVYYASEIDGDSLLVSKVRHSEGVVQWVGDVTSISFEQLQEFSPIDLLIGGSPCNDFSIANPLRKGLNEDGTGVLFYEFYRILTSLREIQTPGRPLFWLFENVASMQKHCRSTISRFFNCFPALLDAKYFSAQRRPRLFWGNIPGMYCPPQYNKTLSASALKDNLFPGRKSQVDKIKTVTTKLNSLMQSSRNEMPVLMNDNEETLFWVPELERIFGFPDHYTDVGDLSRNRRQKLIGQAWSVHVVKHILSPLANIFECI